MVSDQHMARDARVPHGPEDGTILAVQLLGSLFLVPVIGIPEPEQVRGREGCLGGTVHGLDPFAIALQGPVIYPQLSGYLQPGDADKAFQEPGFVKYAACAGDIDPGLLLGGKRSFQEIGDKVCPFPTLGPNPSGELPDPGQSRL
jgi:hypothetical protein